MHVHVYFPNLYVRTLYYHMTHQKQNVISSIGVDSFL